MDNWKFYTDVDFNDETIMQYHIDTRDFHCITNKEKSDEFKVFASLDRKPERYIFNPEEIKQLLDRYFTESGGKHTWRMFTLSGSGADYSGGWQLKYLRIYRVNNGLVVCNSQSYCLQKDILDNKVEQEYLSAHTL
jgi:hypothetical protein